MARGAAGAAQNVQGTTSADAAAQQQNALNEQNSLQGLYTSELNQGFTPLQMENMTSTGEQATAAPFNAAAEQVQNRAARTRNEAGEAPQLDQLAMEKGQAMGQTAAGIQEANANQQYRNTQAGLSGLGNLYGTETGEAESLYGMQPGLVNAWSNAQNNNPWLNLGKSLIGAGGQVGAAYLGGG